MNEEISIGKLADLIAKMMNIKLNIKLTKERLRPDNSEVERLFCDNTKLLNRTSWKPKYTLEQGIREVIEWMKNPENLKKYKTEQYNV